MRVNSFQKYIKGETALHIAVAEYLQYQYPDVMFHHSPNEAKRSPFERYLIKRMGVSSGFPDFMILNEKNKSIFYIELKFENNIPTGNQLNWLRKLNIANHTFVAWSFEAAKKIIDDMLYATSINLSEYSLVQKSYYVCKKDLMPKKIIKQIKNKL